MPERKANPQIDRWADAVLKTLKVEFNDKVEIFGESDELADIPLDDVPLDDVSLEANEDIIEEPPKDQSEEDRAAAELALRKREHSKEVSKVCRDLRSLEKAIKVAGRRRDVFIEDVNLAVFDDAKTLAALNTKQANAVLEKPDVDGFYDLEKVGQFTSRAEEYLRVMQSNYQEGQDVALDEIEGLRGIVEQHQKKAADVYANRKELENWNVDITPFDVAYEQAQSNFTEMNSAMSGYLVSAVHQTLKVAAVNLDILKETFRTIKNEISFEQVKLIERSSSTERDLAELSSRKSELEGNSVGLKDFEKLYASAQSDCKRATAAVSAQNGVEAGQAIERAEQTFIELQQVLLQNITVSGTETENSEQGDVTRLAGDAVQLLQQVDDLVSQEEIVKEHRTDLPAFKEAEKSARKGIADAQSDLIDGNVSRAEDKLLEVKSNLSIMQEAVTEAQLELKICEDHIALLRKQLTPMLARRADILRQVDINPKYEKTLRRYDQIATEVETIIECAETAVKNEKLTEAIEEIANGQSGLKRLRYEVDGLQYLPKINTVLTQEDNAELFMQTLDQLREHISAYDKRKDVFRDKDERAIFDNLFDKAVDYADQAENAFNRQKFKKADDMVDNARISLDGLEIAYQRGVNTAAKIDGFELDINEAKIKIAACENFKDTVSDQKILGEFFSYQNIAYAFAYEAEGFIGSERIQDARGALADLKQALANLANFVAKPPKPGVHADPQSGSDEARTPEEESSDDDTALFIKQLDQLRSDTEGVARAVDIGNKSWARFCEGPYLQKFQEASQCAADELAEANEWFESAYDFKVVDEKSKANATLMIGSIHAPISNAKNALIEMQNAFSASKQILTSQLNGITAGAEYYVSIFEDIYKTREEFAGWSIDLTEFDDAYLTAMDNIAELKIAVEAQDGPKARETLELADDHRQALLQAGEAALRAMNEAETDLVIKLSELQSEQTALYAKKMIIEDYPNTLEAFEKANEIITSKLQEAINNIRAGQGKAAENQISLICQLLDGMQCPISDVEALAAKADAQARSRWEEDPNSFTREKEEAFAAVQKLADTGIKSYHEWKEDCRGDFEVFFEQLYQSLQAKIHDAEAAYHQPVDTDKLTVMKALKEALAEAEKLYAHMDGIHRVSMGLVASILKSMEQRADYYQKEIDKVSAAADKFNDWGMDFADFNEAYDEAKTIIDELRAAVEKNDHVEARELNAKGNNAVEAVKDEYEKYKKLLVDAKASFAEGFEVIRGTVATTAARRNELEHNDRLAAAFDEAERAALTAIDRALGLINSGDRFGPDKESEFINKQIQLMRDLLAQAVPLANDPEKLGQTIDESDTELHELARLKDSIKDSKDLEIFEAMQERGEWYAAEAKRLQDEESYEQAEHNLIALRAVNDALKAAHETGLKTAEKVPDLTQEIDDVAQDLTDLEQLSSTITNKDDLAEFGKLHQIAIRAAFEAKDLLLNSQIRRAQAVLNTLEYYFNKMESLLDKQGTKAPKRKSGKKKGQEPEQELKPTEELELEREDSFDPVNDEEQRAELEDAIAATDGYLEKALAQASDILDLSEREVYDTMCKKAQDYAAAAKDNLRDGELDKGDANIEDLKITLDTLHDVHADGVKTSGLVPEYNKEIDEASVTILSLNRRRNTIGNDKEKTDFDRAYSTAITALFNARRFLDNKSIRKVKYEIESMRESTGKMEKILGNHTSRRQKLKNLLNRKRK